MGTGLTWTLGTTVIRKRHERISTVATNQSKEESQEREKQIRFFFLMHSMTVPPLLMITHNVKHTMGGIKVAYSTGSMYHPTEIFAPEVVCRDLDDTPCQAHSGRYCRTLQYCTYVPFHVMQLRAIARIQVTSFR